VISVAKPAYRLDVSPDGLRATLASPQGEHWATLRLLAALDTAAAPDETLAVSAPRQEDDEITVERRSTVWERAGITLTCRDDAIEVRAWVSGSGALTDVHLLGGRSLIPAGAWPEGPDAPLGFMPSGASFRTLFSPNPGHPGLLVRSAAQRAVVGVSGDGTPGRGHWFFTPAPLWLALTTAERVADPAVPVEEGWLGLGIAAPVAELDFVQLVYEPGDLAFSLRLEYEGHTRVEGDFEAPVLVLTPGMPDVYTGLRRHREDLVALGAAPAPVERERPGWWSDPIFCGWGAQCHLARVEGARAPALATQASYDRFLGLLEAEELVPGTVVIDDKWQTAYGTNEVDTGKWPDLAGWIAARHDRGQHVLLWWKAWDPEGLPPELCIVNPDGAPVALDPTNPATRELLRRQLHRMLGPDGLDADGLKIDFTARTPSGYALAAAGDAWGLALLHELLAVVYDAAKEAKPDALIITQTPNPAFVDVTDMIRLNDMLRMDDPQPWPPVVAQMRQRAEIVRAACPELLIDTDDWCVPDLATWREYVDAKLELGVPSLYYASHLDATGEALEPEDYAALRRTWAEWGARRTPVAEGGGRA
jgi:hypothetical protein